jgi:hypothetical protein
MTYNEFMRPSFKLRGKMSDSRHIELSEPVTGVGEEVEVVIRPLTPSSGQDVFDIIALLAAGSGTKIDIDRQILEERVSWEDR